MPSLVLQMRVRAGHALGEAWSPWPDAATISAELPIGVNNVMRAVAPLVEAGALKEFTGYRRNRMWQSAEVLSALDAFAARAGRRG